MTTPVPGKPNIVFILHDNTGWGDWGVYGGNVATPRIDELASEGIRFNNYSVEGQCTPTRSAILTGRMPSRSGTYHVPLPGQGAYGVCPWEYTLANLLSDAGYATSAWGKWHLGEVQGRLPTDQGFDEWWGEKNTTDEAGYTSYALYRAMAEQEGFETPKMWESKKGEEPRATDDLDLRIRPFLDEMITERAVDYIKRKAADQRPFFTYVALTHLHPPEAPHPDFDQTSPDRVGGYADIIAEQDYRTGQILDAIEEAGIADNTIVIVSSDNATGGVTMAPQGGSNGPWRGDFFTPPFEGSYRAPAMIRWPGHIPGGRVTEQIFTAVDWYRTLAALVGDASLVPTDRPIDSVDASAFMLGHSEATGREHVLLAGPDGEMMSVKYNQIKVVFRYAAGLDQPIVTPMMPLVFDLSSDPGEKFNLMSTRLDMMWMFEPAFRALGEYQASVAQFPNITPGTDFNGY